VNSAYGSEHEELRSTVRRFVGNRSPLAEVRRVVDTPGGYDARAWSQMTGQLGLAGLAIPACYGGVGFGWVEFAIAMQELGAGLVPSPLFASVALAASALLASDDETAKKEFLPGIADGATRAALATVEADGDWDPDAVHSRASVSSEGFLLSGEKHYVVDGAVADLILVSARTDVGLSLFALDANAPGLRRVEVPSLDQTRSLARLEFHATSARLVGNDGAARPVLERAYDVAAVALAAEQAGAAERCLELTVRYAKERSQFGRPIGSFQAIKHRCADLLVEVESAKAVADFAALAAAQDPAALPAAASVAKAVCSDAFVRVATFAVQVHGGIGFTWEHDAHLYLKRAKSAELFLGDAARHREQLLCRLGFPDPASSGVEPQIDREPALSLSQPLYGEIL
jgi:alkylation response protein AidB-like acyl-CoA dehydrogenase